MLDIRTGNCVDVLPTLPAQSVQCCVTSPPYWGLRDYGTAQWEGGLSECDHLEPQGGPSIKQESSNGTRNIQYRSICLKCGARSIDSQLGLESTPEEYVANMVAVFREVWRVLRDDGTLWLNLGDSYAMSTKGSSGKGEKQITNAGTLLADRSCKIPAGLKPKDLVGIPWRTAFALQADGWYLRSDIIWHKPNPMPESVLDRPTKSHEYIFLLSKNERYFYDAEAIQEPCSNNPVTQNRNGRADKGLVGAKALFQTPYGQSGKAGFCRSILTDRNRRTVWTIATQPFAEAHFATFPEEIPKLCILAGSKPGDTVLDPFAGSGTTGKVALELGRKAVLIELNPSYVELAKERTWVTPAWF